MKDVNHAYEARMADRRIDPEEEEKPIPEWAYDRMRELYVDKEGMAASFARYIMSKEEATGPALSGLILFIDGWECDCWRA